MEDDNNDPERVLKLIREYAIGQNLRVTQHAHQEMADENILLDHLIEAIVSGQILEDYPDHRRGPCCLICGFAADGRPLHVVCTTAGPMLIIITVYEPKSPKWETPLRRGQKK